MSFFMPVAPAMSLGPIEAVELASASIIACRSSSPNLGSVAKDRPSAGLFLEVDCVLRLFNIATAYIKRRALRCPGEYKDGVSAAGQAKSAGHGVNWIVGLHLAGMMQDQRCDAPLVSEAVEFGRES